MIKHDTKHKTMRQKLYTGALITVLHINILTFDVNLLSHDPPPDVSLVAVNKERLTDSGRNVPHSIPLLDNTPLKSH